MCSSLKLCEGAKLFLKTENKSKSVKDFQKQLIRNGDYIKAEIESNVFCFLKMKTL